MSTNSTAVGITFCGLTISASAFSRGSGTGTTPTFGSIVQNGKLAAAMPALVSALKRVDLPTFGRPTMPHLMPMVDPGMGFGNGDFGRSAAALDTSRFADSPIPIHGFCVCSRFIASLKSPCTASGSTSSAVVDGARDLDVVACTGASQHPGRDLVLVRRDGRCRCAGDGICRVRAGAWCRAIRSGRRGRHRTSAAPRRAAGRVRRARAASLPARSSRTASPPAPTCR